VHYVSDVFLPALRSAGLDADLTLVRWGWYPRGGGEIAATIRPRAAWDGLGWTERAPIAAVGGVSAVSRLPRHIAERQRQQALGRLRARGLDADVALVQDDEALGPGTMLFLSATGRGTCGGFSALGRRGVPAETIADEAVDALLRYLDSGASVDEHLADQLVPFLALARTPSRFTCPAVTGHLETVAALVEQFLPARIELRAGLPAEVRITP
jgi:RNA 3'-terminal phosphate cyclase (ATP)